MHINTKKLLLLPIAALIVAACDEHTKDPTDVALFIKPVASDTLRVNSNDVVQYEIEMHTTHEYVKHLQVKSFDRVNASRTVLDTMFTSAQDKYTFYYRTPVFNDSLTSVTLTFTGWDNDGNKGETQRHLIVRGRQVLLQEQTGIVLWDPTSGSPNALAFSNASQPFYYLPTTGDDTTLPAPTADMYLTTDDAFTTIGASSATNAKFVRSNSFNYATASANSIQAVYESFRRDNAVADLRVNDIIIVGHDAQAEGVLQVTGIVRTGTVQERSLRLSFKGITR